MLLMLLLVPVIATAAPLHFPDLTGPVVDDAHILSAQTVASLTQKLADYQNGTGNQVVVVTLPSLQGDSIEDYGYRLGRVWAIGQKQKNNGALLIVVPSERRVRIEVGYGDEPLLTDAASSEIINGIIFPAFKAGDMERGVRDGTFAMLAVLGGQSKPTYAPVYGQSLPPAVSKTDEVVAIAIILIILGLCIRYPDTFGQFFGQLLFNLLLNAVFRASSSSSNGSEFRGGGGSFGGGGASGSW